LLAVIFGEKEMNKYERIGGIAALAVIILIWGLYKLALLQALFNIGG